MKVYKIVPFRLSSQRFPGKPLCFIFGKTMLENALDIAGSINPGETILTAPEEDYEKVLEKIPALRNRQYTYIATGSTCKNATERVLELYRQLDGDIFVSIPMDEPALIPGQLERYIRDVTEKGINVLTLYCDFYCMEDAISNLSAKIVTNNRNEILYMSRSVIPVAKNGTIELKHLKKNVGVFYFSRDFLDKLASLSHIETKLDKLEGLEQLKWLELGLTVKAGKVTHYGFGIDVPGQVGQLEKRIECLQQQKK
ncbi:MAG: hypothetical protein JXB88_00055 [Spirochaetales bacterium]|nr:hypothetical protein [Spirochaetales bacterium]